MGKTVNIAVRQKDYDKFVKIAAKHDIKLNELFQRMLDFQEGEGF